MRGGAYILMIGTREGTETGDRRQGADSEDLQIPGDDADGGLLLDEILHLLELVVDVAPLVGDHDHAKAGPVPEIEMIGLGDGDVEPSPDPLDEAPHDPPLVLEGEGLGNLQGDLKGSYEHR